MTRLPAWTLALPALAVLAGCGAGGSGGGPVAATQTAGATQGQDRPEARPAAVRNLRLRRIGRFSSPTYLTAPRGDRRRLFVVEQGGTIRVVRRGRKLARPFLDIRDRVQSGGERGLLSMAFAPGYARSRRFYVYFTDRTGDIRVQEFRGRGDRAVTRSARNVLRQRHRRFPNHNGGQLQFGPDGLLYLGLGDGGGGGDPFRTGQDLGSFLGKILRIDPRRAGRRPFRVPRSNPFRGRRGARGAVYSYGLRNPWRFSFDRRTGDLTIADVGQSTVEEVDFVRRGRGAGANFGWSVFEGTRRFRSGSARGHVPPVLEHTQARDGFCAITGGYVLRHRSYGRLRGLYVYGDFCNARLRGARLVPGRVRSRRLLAPRVPALSSFGEDAIGRVYAVSLNGSVYRLAPR